MQMLYRPSTVALLVWVSGLCGVGLGLPVLAQEEPLLERSPSADRPLLDSEPVSETVTETVTETEIETAAGTLTIAPANPAPLDYSSTTASDLLNEGQDLVVSITQFTPASSASADLDDAMARSRPDTDGGQLRFYLGSEAPYPTTLFGPTRSAASAVAIDRSGGFKIPGGVEFALTDSDFIALELIAGTSILGADLSYTHFPEAASTGFSVNVFNQRSYSSNLRGGDRDVDLPGGDTPWVHRLGVGAEVFHEFTPSFSGALGVTYQRVSVRDDVFSDDLFSRDEFFNRLTESNSGQDDILTFGIAGQYDTRDDTTNPTTGTRARFGLEQAIALEDENISFTALTGNVSQFIPLNLFGFGEGPRTLVLNVQAGHIFNDVPSYEAYSLGGSSSVRGFNRGEVGSGTSFIQASAEYRFPMFSFAAFDEDIDVGGLIFVDYASALDTQSDVLGDPGLVRDKPGDGLGFGLGLRAISPLGPIRLEFGLTDEGDSAVHLNLGDRF